MRKILLATPCRDALSIEYVCGLVPALTGLREYEFIPEIVRATCINTARNDIVEIGYEKQVDDIVFLDADVEWQPVELARMLSHDVDIVGGDYAKRVAGEPQMTARAVEGAKPTEDGLVECTSLPAGFLRVKMNVFRWLKEMLPQRRYIHANGTVCCEYFPTGLVEKDGWRHPAEVQWDDWKAGKNIPDPVCVELIHEDIGFCRLARGLGFTLWCDTKLRLRHHGDIGYPAQQITF